MKSTLLAPLALAAVTAAATLGQGCIVHDYDDDNDPPPPDPYGDIAFEWSFDGIATCDAAGVDEVDVAIFSGSELVLDLAEEPCEGGGLIFTDIHSGFYEVFVDAYDRNGVLLYAGSFGIRVQGGQTNDAGVVVLENINAPEPVETYALGLFWTFQYPQGDQPTTFDCAQAGVEEVDISLVPLGDDGLPYDDTFDCDAEGVEVSNLPSGRYELRIEAFGSYHGGAIALYDTGVLIVDVSPENDVFVDGIVDLGDVLAERVQESFSDFDVAWGFVDQTCAGAGLEDVTISFQRFEHEVPEDVITVDCGASGALRPTFVPGSYDVSVAGIGFEEQLWLGTTTVDLPPGSVAEVDVVLAPST